MIYKSEISNIITDVDTKKGIVKGYFSIFGNVDADGDVILPGAYTKTIAENKRIKHLYQHNVSQPLSSVRSGRLKLWEDSTGLLFESQISDTTWGRDAIKLYEDGVVDEHSVGIRVLKAAKRDGYREIREVLLMEGSTVTWGANESARLLGVKSENVLKALRNGTYENEEIFDLLEIFLSQQASEPLKKSTQHRKPVEETTFFDGIAEFLNKHKIQTQ